MSSIQFRAAVLGIVFGASLASTSAIAAMDNAAAEDLLKDNKCTKCHAIDRKKDGPAYRDVAAKFRPEADAQKKLTHHMTAGDMVKFPDGHEERHKKIKVANTDELNALITWMLALPGGTKY